MKLPSLIALVLALLLSGCGTTTQETPSAQEALTLALSSQAPIAISGESQPQTLEDYCQSLSQQVELPVSVTRYAILDMDQDQLPEAVVDFQFGENDTVMCLVVKNREEGLYGQPFYYRQMFQIKTDGTFRFSGGADNDGFGQLSWQSGHWQTMDAADSQQPEVTWTSDFPPAA